MCKLFLSYDQNLYLVELLFTIVDVRLILEDNLLYHYINILIFL